MKIVSVQAKLLLLTACEVTANKFVRTRKVTSENVPRDSSGSFHAVSSFMGNQNSTLRMSSIEHVEPSSNLALPADELADPSLKTTRATDDAFAENFFDNFELIVVTPPASNELGDNMTDDSHEDNVTDVRFEWIPKDSGFNLTAITHSATFSPTWSPTLSPTAATESAPSTENATTLQPSTLNPSPQSKDEPSKNPSTHPALHPSSTPTKTSSLVPSLYPSFRPITSSPSRRPTYSPTTHSPSRTPKNSPAATSSPSDFSTSALLKSTPSHIPSGYLSSAILTSTPSRSTSANPLPAILTSATSSSPGAYSPSAPTKQSKNFESSFLSKAPVSAPTDDVVSVAAALSRAPTSYNHAPMTLDSTSSAFEDLASIDLPPMSLSLKVAPTSLGDIDTSELNSLFSGYLKEYLYLELPNRYQLRDIDSATNFFMDNGTMQEYLVTGTVEVLNSSHIDLTELQKDLSLTLSAHFEGQESSSVPTFLEILRSSEDEILALTSEVTISLLEPLEEPSTVSAATQEDEADNISNRNMYFIIACAGFGVAILLLGYSIYYSRSKRKARKSRSRKRSAYPKSHQARNRHYSPDSDRSPDSYDAVENNIPVVDFIIEACSSLMSGESDKRSYRSNGQLTVRTRDVENDCGWFCAPNKPKPPSRSFSVPQRRPYPYPASQPVPVKSHVRRNTQPTDLALTMKSSASAREEWTCVDGLVTKKTKSSKWDISGR